jgi:hypothetical protein
MAGRLKRTYNLSEETVRRVRELAGKYGTAGTQDAVVEMAVDLLFAEVRDREEASLWAASIQDPGFRSEMAGLASEFGDEQTWP